MKDGKIFKNTLSQRAGAFFDPEAEPKATNQMTDDEVPAKKEAAIRWCQQASEHALNHDGRPWTYVLIPHDSIAENMTLDGMARQYSVKR